MVFDRIRVTAISPSPAPLTVFLPPAERWPAGGRQCRDRGGARLLNRSRMTFAMRAGGRGAHRSSPSASPALLASASAHRSWFTIVNAYLFKAVRLPQPTALHGLSWDSSAHERYKLTLAEFEALAADNPVFAQLAAGNSVMAAMPNGQSMAGHLVTAEYFAVLGAPAALGRTLSPADLTASASATVLVLSDAAWRRDFNADPSIVGKQIALAGAPLTVIGVTRPGATLPGDETIGFWAPLTLTATFGVPDWRRVRGDRYSSWAVAVWP